MLLSPQLRQRDKEIHSLSLCLAEVWGQGAATIRIILFTPIGFALNLKRRRALHSLRDHQSDACAARSQLGGRLAG